MELRQLRYFVAVAEQGNISRAAKKIFLTQPALSRQIRALEEQVGQCLLERQAHSIRLTPAGEALLREAPELLRHAEQVLDRVREAGVGPRLRIGYAPSLSAGILSPAVAIFTQAHRSARIELMDLSTNEMRSGLASGELDVALSVGEQRATPGLTWELLVRAPWRLAVHRKHSLARRSRVTPAEVVREPLLGFCRRDYPEYWRFIDGWLRRHKQRPRIAGEYNGTENLMAAVESGLGVAFVTTQVARLFPKRARLITLSSAPEPVCIAAGQRSNRAEDRPLAVFVEELRKAARMFA
ncbi:MAG TPA: LysR family transcriptional regulator [Candidatus Paceibacterota bacterium]|nr:LysR family transcriptional regulator [Verrucomicrobiota bacterium]HSA11623.1 LysR family transcriptional regulator [Candidatus Paceibacterota bacterium]